MWIETVPYDEAESELRAIYDRQATTLGEPTECTRLGSLYPPLVAVRLDLYSATERCPSNLTLRQRNLIGFVTSALNSSIYHSSAVAIKLRQDGLTDEQITALADDPTSVDLPAADRAVVSYAVKLTKNPGSVTEADIDRLRAAGFDDLAILDANAHCAHLNYTNRVSHGLGITHAVDPDFRAYAAIPPDVAPSDPGN